LDEIITLAPAFVDLWETHGHVLESGPRSILLRELGNLIREHLSARNKPGFVEDDDEMNDYLQKKSAIEAKLERFQRLPESEFQQFSDYKVHTVGDMLVELTEVPLNQLKQSGMPEAVLNAVITADHFVILNQIPSDSPSPNVLPVADRRVAARCKTLDYQIIRLALMTRAGIRLQKGYYGYDLAIPYCMEDDSIGIIGVQTKRGEADATKNIYKMQARSHIVKCSNVNCGGWDESSRCSKCIPRPVLKKMFENQVSIILSLDDDENVQLFNDKDRIKFDKVFETAERKRDLEAYLNNVIDREKFVPLPEEVQTRSFFKPLARSHTTLNEFNNVLLSKTLWDDRFYGSGTINVGKNSIPFEMDHFTHRQYTISIRGWSRYTRLFKNWSNCFKIANELMDGPSLFRNGNFSNENFALRRILADDLSFSFPQLSNEVSIARENPSILDLIDLKDNILPLPAGTESENRDMDIN
jgi:hypothetical protein